MVRRFLQAPLSQFRPLFSAVQSFCFETTALTKKPPHIRDAVDLKRWMILVVMALLPCTAMAIWNTGVQAFVYGSESATLFQEYLNASSSWSAYWSFCTQEERWLTILGKGCGAFLPLLLISYAVGGFWEALFAILRKHEIAEGFLVTGILYALILPPTLPYWMAILGISFGVVVGKELFGGTGMNILNPALTARVFLFFTFPGQMTGEIWVGTHPTYIAQSVQVMNREATLPSWDGWTQATPLAQYNIGNEVKRIHVAAIDAYRTKEEPPAGSFLEKKQSHWLQMQGKEGRISGLTGEELRAFVTDPPEKGGLGLPTDSYGAAYHFSTLRGGWGIFNNWNLFFGNRPGSLGETSIFFVILGALFMLWVGVASWRTMVAVLIGAYLTALLFQLGATWLGPDGGMWNPARLAFPAYKHLLMGSLLFGLVFMATEPVTSPYMRSAKWIYGLLVGLVTLCIRAINPAFPEGVMLAILFGNVFAPLIDTYAILHYRRSSRVRVRLTPE